ncbi:DUF6776 family protein [Oceanicoccus sp. KOV_DT_Chl]|uniref:DUF6776 family protein n=1 Tax=Oceanicoccus sp. KOV_DT_Chl TaxID=1904639 RepID=UPI000C7B4AA9|nr:DUF6776 family protein [Oceanicoccus sp. KOV_DT_Chl]
MSEVKGSKQIRSVVVQDRPERRVLIVSVLLVVLIVAVAIAYWQGGRVLHEQFGQLKIVHQQTLLQLQQTEQQLQQASQQLVNSRVGAEVDREAVDDVRATIREQKQTINELTEEISFYKGLMAPTDRESGLGIRSWEVYAEGDARRLQFKLVLQQLALKHTVLNGNVSVLLVGKQADAAGIEQEQSYTLDRLSEQVSEKPIKLRFKYFQYVEGELQLPEGFYPERVEIIAKATKPKRAKSEKIYGWVVQGEST